MCNSNVKILVKSKNGGFSVRKIVHHVFFKCDSCQTFESWGHHVYVFISCKMFIFQRVISQTRAVGGQELKEDVANSQSPEEKPDATVKATQRCQEWKCWKHQKAWCMLFKKKG